MLNSGKGLRVSEFMYDLKVGVAVASSTAATSVGSWFDIIPDDIGKLGVVLSATLAVVLIYVNYRKGSLEIRLLEKKLKEVEKRG